MTSSKATISIFASLALLSILIPRLSLSELAPSLEIFQKPFTAEYSMYNWFDHEKPYQFTDTNGYLLTSEGEKSSGIDGHNGYDWALPTGTPLLAVADGTITFSGNEDPFFCPLLNSSVSGLHVVLKVVSGEESFLIDYVHMDTLAVTNGQTVKAGDVIGTSGNTGCSSREHLHFAVYRLSSDKSRFVMIDPYGWSQASDDPWALDPAGIQSLSLWKKGSAPERFLEASDFPNPCADCKAPIAITKFRYMGTNDDANPNNEFVELTLDTRFSTKKHFDLSGFFLMNNSGKRFKFPRGAKIKANRPLKVFSGKGKSKGTSLFLNKKMGIWSNLPADCVHLFYPDKKTLMYTFRLYNATCNFDS